MRKNTHLLFSTENSRGNVFPVSHGNNELGKPEPATPARGLRRFLFIKSEYKIVKIMLDDILFCEGMKDYTQVFVAGRSQPVITLQNLKTFSGKLPVDDFVRVHRSFIISISRIDSISRNEVMIGSKMIPIGSSYRNHFFSLIEQHS